jgi:hypothetical protein
LEVESTAFIVEIIVCLQ